MNNNFIKLALEFSIKIDIIVKMEEEYITQLEEANEALRNQLYKSQNNSEDKNENVPAFQVVKYVVDQMMARNLPLSTLNFEDRYCCFNFSNIIDVTDLIIDLYENRNAAFFGNSKMISKLQKHVSYQSFLFQSLLSYENLKDNNTDLFIIYQLEYDIHELKRYFSVNTEPYVILDIK